MADTLFFVLHLKPGVDPVAYERWVREVDYPTTRRQPGVISYEVTRVERAADGTDPLQAQYLEVIRVEDAEAYEARLADGSPEFRAMLEQWDDYVVSKVGGVGTLVRDTSPAGP
jgi:quinol monooxygenase YgiN